MGGAELEFVGRVYAEAGEPGWVIWGSNFVQTFRPNFVTLHFTGYEPSFNLIVGAKLVWRGGEGIVESPEKGSKDQFASALEPSLAFCQNSICLNWIFMNVQQMLENIHNKYGNSNSREFVLSLITIVSSQSTAFCNCGVSFKCS